MIMFTGVAVLGLLAGNLASFMRLQPAEPTTAGEAPTDPPVDGDLTRRLDAIQY